MAYALRHRDDDLTAALRRIATEEIGAALARLEAGAPDAGGVHDVRKRIKKLRGLLRLVRPGLAEAGDEIAALRQAAQGLAPVRDAEVMLMWHDRLAPGTAGALRAWLAGRIAAARGSGDELRAAVATARGVLADMAGRAGAWRVRGSDAGVLRRSLVRTLRRGAAAMAEAQASRDAEALHDWRKRVKDLWYQTRILAPVWPEAVGVWQATADDLGERLGDHHDLAVLMPLLDSAPAEAAAEAVAMRARARLAASEIEAKVFAAGARLHAGDPEAVAALFVDWWRVWRRR